jgi:16S rRNA (uracil1498-N3)-methyltransferase
VSEGHWFFSSSLAAPGEVFALSDPEAGHAIRTRRLRPEDHLTLFDGKGGLADAVISDISQKPLKVQVRVKGLRTVDPPRPNLHVMTALPKGDRQSTMIDMLTQVGMDQFSPLLCERCVSRPQSQHYPRWERLVIEASKQSRRAWLPELCAPLPLDAANLVFDGPLLVADGEGEQLDDLTDRLAGVSDAVHLAVGPEGGFTDNERQLLRESGAHFVSLGPNVLRVETAAVSLSAVIRGLCGKP